MFSILRFLKSWVFGLFTLMLLFGCSQTQNPASSIDAKSNKTVSHEIIASLSDAGFDTTDYFVSDEYIILEGDIAFSLTDFNVGIPNALAKTTQWRHSYIISDNEVGNITISVENNLPTSWRSALNVAVSAWTGIVGSKIQLVSVTSNADITVRYIDFASLGINPAGVIGMGPFPLSSGFAEPYLYRAPLKIEVFEEKT